MAGIEISQWLEDCLFNGEVIYLLDITKLVLVVSTCEPVKFDHSVCITEDDVILFFIRLVAELWDARIVVDLYFKRETLYRSVARCEGGHLKSQLVNALDCGVGRTDYESRNTCDWELVAIDCIDGYNFVGVSENGWVRKGQQLSREQAVSVRQTSERDSERTVCFNLVVVRLLEDWGCD